MDQRLKRTFPTETFDKFESLSKETTGKNKRVDISNHDVTVKRVCLSRDVMKGIKLKTDGFDEDYKVEAESRSFKKILLMEQQKSRLELNRQRAREIRKRKKLMVEEMQKQILFLSKQNKKLKLESQMQKEELTFLRETSSLVTTSANMSIAQTSAPPVTPSLQARLSEYDILKLITNIHNNNTGNTNTNADHLSNILGNSEPSRDTFLNPGARTSSIIGLGHETLQNDTYPFTFQR